MINFSKKTAFILMISSLLSIIVSLFMANWELVSQGSIYKGLEFTIVSFLLTIFFSLNYIRILNQEKDASKSS